jgi:hypothetical protein
VQKRQIILLSFLMAVVFTAAGQYYYGGFSSSLYFPRTQYMVDSSGNILFKPGDIGVSVQAGTGFGSNFKGNSAFSTFVAPAVSYNVSNRFRLKAGVSVNNYFGEPYYGMYDTYHSLANTNLTTTSVFLQGDYLLSNKFILSGAIYKEFYPFNANVSDPRYRAPESQGMILNLNYRPARNFEIDVSFEYGSGRRSMFQDPMYRNGMNSWGSPW